ncbi:OB-fold domain-containing protein [Candidatus Gottesmanbacteria bacterium]|nr:OB-fold domain-containing protein [Candidatus Gottesmanbacteria bacterium]
MSLSPVKVWRNQKKITKLLGKKGRIISYSMVHVPPAGFENNAPYPVALVEFTSDKSRYIAQLTDWEKSHLQIGQKVKTVLRKTRDIGTEGIIPYGIKFKPIS